MKVLVACEYSGVVRDAFLNLNHNAISCDLLPSESPGPHIQGDVSEILSHEWDLVIAHPPCTYLSKVSAVALSKDSSRYYKLLQAREFFLQCLNANAYYVAVENPMMLQRANLPPPTQWIQPWQFGHPYSKNTGLWLKHLPKLLPTRVIDTFESFTKVHDNATKSTRGKLRSKTFEGIAQAMAEQWGRLTIPTRLF